MSDQHPRSSPMKEEGSTKSASQVHGVNLQLVLWMVLSSYLTSDPKMLVCAARPHARTIERVVGIGFQPGLDPAILQSNMPHLLPAVQQNNSSKSLAWRVHNDAPSDSTQPPSPGRLDL